MTQWLAQIGIGVVAGLAIGLFVGRSIPGALPRASDRSERWQREERERHSRDAILSALAHAARILFGAEGNDQVMPKALQVLGEAVGADRVYVFENHRDPETGELLASQRYEWCRPGIRALIDEPGMQGMSYDRLIPNWRDRFLAREPVVGLVEEMPPLERELLEPQEVLSILIVPVFLDGEFWGLIGFDDCSSRRHWEQAEINALRIAAGTIGGAIRSMRADEELRHLVSTDSLTGLSSRRAFLERGRAMFEEASRGSNGLALMIMDLDQFKAVNDQYGHPAGDEALVAFARICRGVLRDDDLIGRTGGEEFGVLLPDTGSEQAGRLAEKLREAVDSTPVQTSAGDLTLSVSIGAAVSTPGMQALNELFKRADDALYAAKRGGRNRIEVADQPE
ncbi:GGDEF domain-containing protein [Wenzhouxiangella sediminis]|uniref:diguanylate cyclase n=1 Tax=Wenzhouxiangella sediminis TaxID=1792836 RepID=A0A3E1KCN1_9GAMM|nr:sensor domain-containing diguanylate cyclase [Wenzhouxiangella sediminis]RFF32728.1 sensor domain-containing diguanylate cyclase [Wenzhouxiangella sediminis]